MATYRKRGQRWQVAVCVKGVRASATFSTKAEAKAWADEREATGLPGALPKRSLHQAFNRYAAEVSPEHEGHRWELLRLTRWKRELADVPLARLTSDDLDTWVRSLLRYGSADKHGVRRGRPLSAGTVRRELNLLRTVLGTAVRPWKWIRVNPLDDVEAPPPPRPRDRRISDDELLRLRLALGWPSDTVPRQQAHQVALMLELAIETGMRAGELLSIRRRHVHLGERYVHLEKSKNGDRRDVPLSPRALELAQLALVIHDGEHVFTVPPRNRDTIFRDARVRAQIENLHFHDTRHEACTRLARKLDVLDLARMIGHRDLRSLQVYYNPTATEMAARLA